MRILKFLSVLLLAGSLASAGTITYTFTGTASGSVETSPGVSQLFEGAFTITSHADTAAITTPVSGVFRVLPTSSTIQLSGLGVGTILIDTSVVSNNNLGVVVLGDMGRNLALMITTNGVFTTYNLATAIGPVATTVADGVPAGQFQGISTTLGAVSFNSIVADEAFAASVGNVPEPASGLLMGLGLGAVALVARRRV